MPRTKDLFWQTVFQQESTRKRTTAHVYAASIEMRMINRNYEILSGETMAFDRESLQQTYIYI